MEASGFKALAQCLQDGDANLARRAVFLLTALFKTEEHPDLISKMEIAAREAGLGSMVVSFLTFDDEDLVEKACTCLIAWEAVHPNVLSLLPKESIDRGLVHVSKMNALKDLYDQLELLSRNTTH